MTQEPCCDFLETTSQFYQGEMCFNSDSPKMREIEGRIGLSSGCCSSMGEFEYGARYILTLVCYCVVKERSERREDQRA